MKGTESIENSTTTQLTNAQNRTASIVTITQYVTSPDLSNCVVVENMRHAEHTYTRTYVCMFLQCAPIRYSMYLCLHMCVYAFVECVLSLYIRMYIMHTCVCR